MSLNLKAEALAIRQAAGLPDRGTLSLSDIMSLCRTCTVQLVDRPRWEPPQIAVLDGPELSLALPLRDDWWRLMVAWACASRWLGEPTPGIVRQAGHLGDGDAGGPLLPRSRELALWLLAGRLCPGRVPENVIADLLGVPRIVGVAWRRWVLRCRAERQEWRQSRAV